MSIKTKGGYIEGGAAINPSKHGMNFRYSYLVVISSYRLSMMPSAKPNIGT
jgi:hypothetical protein